MLHIRIVPWVEDEDGCGLATDGLGFPVYGIHFVANESKAQKIDAPIHPSRASFLNGMDTYTAFIMHPDGEDKDHWIYVVRQWSWWKTGLLLIHELIHWVAWYLPGEWVHDAIDYVPKRLRSNHDKA